MRREDLNDHQSLRQDPLFQTCRTSPNAPPRPDGSGQERGCTLAWPPTLCRLDNLVDRKALTDIAKVFVEAFIASYLSDKSDTREPDVLILDFDATDDPLHGNQHTRFFHGYYDNYCFLPLYVFCGSQLLVANLGPSNIDPALHSRAIRTCPTSLKLLVERIRKQWPNVKIIFRGDSGFCRWRLMRWCDRRNVGYIIGLASKGVL